MDNIKKITAKNIHNFEQDEHGAFFWTKKNFEILIGENKNKYIRLHIGCPKNQQKLSVKFNGEEIQNSKLSEGWHDYNFKLPKNLKNDSILEFNLDSNYVVKNEARELGVMIRDIKYHSNDNIYEGEQKKQKNYLLNNEEFKNGVSKLKSVPPYLRITMEVKCNIANKNPCVYCSWDWAKEEEIGSPVHSKKFIKDLNKYLNFAYETTDCSYGEPPLNNEFSEITNLLTENGRVFGLTSNGQPLSKKIRKAMLGKRVNLYVSIDSSNAEGYAKYRDDGFDLIIKNLKDLCNEKKEFNNLPYLSVSFIVMQSNKNEIKDYLNLMKDIGVDMVNFRALWREDNLTIKQQTRSDYFFNYEKENLSYQELEKIAEEIKSHSEKINQNFNIEWDTFNEKHSSDIDSLPICSEPWKSLYVLNRGITPCCYGRKPIETWDKKGNKSLEQFIDEVFNGEKFVELREKLSKHEFPKYCLESKNCPIVRKKLGDKISI